MVSKARLRDELKIATFLGWLSGMAADLDVLIQSAYDPLLYLEYHRQFTHSLVFIPIGGLICGSLLYLLPWVRRKLSFIRTLLFCTAGYASHGLLDACTSYGTQLFWPFSNTRVDWSLVSIIDPVFTIGVLACFLWALKVKKNGWQRVSLVVGCLYLAFGFFQRHRAQTVAWQLAKKRGHQPVEVQAKPSFGNNFLWKTIYRENNKYYVDAVRVLTSTLVYPGQSISAYDHQKDFPELSDLPSRQINDIERFRWFSADHLAKDPTRENFIMDLRYSFVPNEVDAMWGIRLFPGEDRHVDFEFVRKLDRAKKNKFISMLLGRQ